MSKAVLISIQPYYVFLIIAKAMGWDIPQEKTIEVRKTIPKDQDWDKKQIFYCTKNNKSFNQIPKEYQPLMKQFLGKVVGEFVCNKIIEMKPDSETEGIYDISDEEVIASCLVYGALWDYGIGKTLYGWYISNLVIYDKPKEITQFLKPCKCDFDIEKCMGCENLSYNDLGGECCDRRLTRPPQSWCYVEGKRYKKANEYNICKTNKLTKGEILI